MMAACDAVARGLRPCWHGDEDVETARFAGCAVRPIAARLSAHAAARACQRTATSAPALPGRWWTGTTRLAGKSQRRGAWTSAHQ
jgi:hypothetical protein